MTGDKAELINRIIERRHQVGRYLHEDYPDVWLTLNLTIAQLKSLMFINFEGSPNFKMLARALRVSPPNVTGIVDRLVEQELVSREDNPQNRRMQVLKTTEKGKALIRELMERGESRFSSVLNIMRFEDLEKLSESLAALISAAQQSSEKSADCAAEEVVDNN